MKNKLCIFTFAILFICILFASCTKADDICGLWESEEDRIMLHLRSDKNGNLAIGGEDYKFTYSTTDTELVLKFLDDEVDGDARYKYEISSDMLTLKSDKTEIILTRHYE